MKKNLFLCSMSLLMTCMGFCQSTLPALDKSPLDISYCPGNYPVLKIQDKARDHLLARVIYSRPQKNGRVIFGELIEYGKVWRLGANEATEIEFYQNVNIGGNAIKKGRYTLYAIPNEDKWTIIINKETDTWGSFRYDMKKDLARIDVPAEKITDIAEVFTIMFDKTNSGYVLQFYWDNIKVSLPVSQQ